MDDKKEIAQSRAGTKTPDRGRLYEVAAEQGGYFTMKQAMECGYSRALIAYHAKRGIFVWIRQGLYRFREYQPSDHEDVLAAWLSAGKDIAVVSHESALDMLGLTDVIPNVIHITVPRAKRSITPRPGVKIHTTKKAITKAEIVVRDGITTTSPTRTILDVAESGIDPEQVERAVSQAVNRGLATAHQLQEKAGERGKKVDMLITNAIKKLRQ